MTMNYEELTPRTRAYMLAEFEAEQAGPHPYVSKALSPEGRAAFPSMLREALTGGTPESLTQDLDDAVLWEPEETYVRSGVARTRKRNIPQAAHRLALSEFSTWYVRGLAKVLLEEQLTNCQIYRGETPKWEPGECAEHEGMVVPVRQIYDAHRARYWPEPGDPDQFSIPFSPGCHHVIRRVR